MIMLADRSMPGVTIAVPPAQAHCTGHAVMSIAKGSIKHTTHYCIATYALLRL